MPDYLKRVGRDITEDTTIRIPESEKTIARLRGPASKRLGIDRGSIPSVAAPLEGQMMLQYADEAVGSTPVAPSVGDTFTGENAYYYSNGEWRPFSGCCPDPDYGYYETAGITVLAGRQDLDSWQHHSGATILDLSDPQNPAFTTRGVYSVTGTASFDAGWTAGCFPFGTLIFSPDLVSWTTDFFFQSQPYTGGGFSNFPPNASFAATFQADVGASLQLQFSNFENSVSHAFSATQIRVQRIYSF